MLSRLDEPGLPWHRVVRADGSLAMGERQRVLLEREGVPFRGARVDMEEAWVPAERVGLEHRMAVPPRSRPALPHLGPHPRR